MYFYEFSIIKNCANDALLYDNLKKMLFTINNQNNYIYKFNPYSLYHNQHIGHVSPTQTQFSASSFLFGETKAKTRGGAESSRQSDELDSKLGSGKVTSSTRSSKFGSRLIPNSL